MVEQVLKNYKKIRNKEKSLIVCANAEIETLKAISYNGIGEGKRSCKYITGNAALELSIIKKEELLQKAAETKKIADQILSEIAELKQEKNGDELFGVINLGYIENKTNNQIQEELNLSSATMHRRRKEALELLNEKGLWALFYKLDL